MRNTNEFPNDENGEVLWYMREQGDDLSIAREIDFTVVLSDERRAIEFAVEMLKNGMKVSYTPDEAGGAGMIDVNIHSFMVPTHGNITDFENQLAKNAGRYGGKNDGWGSIKQGKS
jgi:hypothetical protein